MNRFEVMIHGLATLSIIALVAALIRCVILAIFTVSNFQTGPTYNNTHVFDLIHSFIQSIHVVEYFALLYGIGGFYLFMVIQRDKYSKLNDVYKETSRELVCTCSYTCTGFLLVCLIGMALLTVSAFVPLVLLTMYRTDIVTASRTEILTKMYVGISYFSHVCHSVTRVFMVYTTVLVRSAWLDNQKPADKLEKHRHENGLVILAKMVFKPKWLEHEDDGEDTGDPKADFINLIEKYNTTGQFISALHAIFQQWFVMQWFVYFIKIIEDFSVALNSLVTEKYNTEGESEKLWFVLTHLVFDLILFLIPYFCASLFNQYHDEYRERLRKVQNDIFSRDEDGWRLQCAELIPENSKYIFIPSFCGLSIPLSSPGYNLSIIFALFAFIISIMTAL